MAHRYRYACKHWKHHLWSIVIFAGLSAQGQHYSAVHGSSEFAGLHVYNNPSAILSSPYSWDLTLFGVQAQTISNALKGPNFPFMLSPKSRFTIADGNEPRMADIVSNVRLLNGRFMLNRRHSIAFGANVRSYIQARTSNLNYTDQVVGPTSFLMLNEENRTLSASMRGNTWLEVYGSYARTLSDDATGRLNAGITLKVTRGMSGAFVDARDIGIVRNDENDLISYKIANGSAAYGFSDNHGDFNRFDINDLLAGSRQGFAADLGIEYVVKTQRIPTIDEPANYHEYVWKIGFSILDLGRNQFMFDRESRSASRVKDNISGYILQEKFAAVKDLAGFNDSLATIVDDYDVLAGKFSVLQPVRAVLNVDRHLDGHFFVNGEVSINLSGLSKNERAVMDPKLLTITPRWETRKLGVYVPIQYTRHANFWFGAALKAGPVLIGTHNLLNIFSKRAFIGGGGYIGVTLRPSAYFSERPDKRYDCPPI